MELTLEPLLRSVLFECILSLFGGLALDERLSMQRPHYSGPQDEAGQRSHDPDLADLTPGRLDDQDVFDDAVGRGIQQRHRDRHERDHAHDVDSR